MNQQPRSDIDNDPLAMEINRVSRPDAGKSQLPARNALKINKGGISPSNPPTNSNASSISSYPSYSKPGNALSSQGGNMTHFVTCTACGKQYSPRALACPGCGEPNKFKMCPDCGAQCSRRAVSCPKCGAPFDQSNQSNNNNNVVNVVVGNTAAAAGPQGVVTGSAIAASGPYGAAAATAVPMQNNYVTQSRGTHNKWIAFCLCLFLGYLGAHRFYEGKIGTGILYFFTLGLVGIGAIIDLIIILCKDEYY